MPEPRTPEWYAAVEEEIVDPARPIIDPHHHLWETTSMWGRYVLDDLWGDTESGHNIEKTVFIDCFGPERCMFESNFPVDKLSIAYHVMWNGMKKIVADFSADEKQAMFYGTAARIYRL